MRGGQRRQAMEGMLAEQRAAAGHGDRAIDAVQPGLAEHHQPGLDEDEVLARLTLAQQDRARAMQVGTDAAGGAEFAQPGRRHAFRALID